MNLTPDLAPGSNAESIARWRASEDAISVAAGILAELEKIGRGEVSAALTGDNGMCLEIELPSASLLFVVPDDGVRIYFSISGNCGGARVTSPAGVVGHDGFTVDGLIASVLAAEHAATSIRPA